MEDENLAFLLKESLQTREKSRWERFIRFAQPVVAAAVLNTLWRLKGSESGLADDLIQDTFLKLCEDDFRILKNFRSDNSNALQTYLKTVASSTVVDHLRAQSAQSRGSGRTPIDLDDASSQVVSADNPFRSLERKQRLERIEECLSEQKQRDRDIFWLYHRQGFTPRMIAALPGIGLGPNGVETILYRLTKALMKCLQKAGVLESLQLREGGAA